MAVYPAGAAGATVVYELDDPPYGPRGDRRLISARVTDGKMQWRYAGDHTFVMSADGTSLTGTREFAGKLARVVMRPVPASESSLAIGGRPMPTASAAIPQARLP